MTRRTLLLMLMGALYIGIAEGKCFKKVFQISPDEQVSQDKLPPIFYRDEYNVSPFWGLERLIHPFDGCKYGKVAAHLQRVFDIHGFRRTEMVSDNYLKKIHTQQYLDIDLKKSQTIENLLGIPLISWLPISFLDRNILDPMRYATQGTIEAAQLALQYGWAINLSGGYHHAKAAEGDGFCVFADIPLAIAILRETHPKLKVLIIDLDAHEGNGNASIIGSDREKLTYIFDMYSKNNYPREDCVQFIDFPYALPDKVSTKEYLTYLNLGLPQALGMVQPDLIIYNAGTDIYEKDPLGNMSVSREGIIKRDEFVFSQALHRKIPILMVLSGGYTPESASIISESIENFVTQLQLLPVRNNKHAADPVKI